jgi:methylated-DNA-[protein]-cysteine S-methyltransferase
MHVVSKNRPGSKVNFNERCYALLKQVPKGKVTTYKALARAMESKGYRAVGNAMNKNPYAPQVPCHRVINANGSLGGFAHGLGKKIEMLKSEGVIVENNKVDLARYQYAF